MVHTGPSSLRRQTVFSSSSIKVSFHQEKPEDTSLKECAPTLVFTDALSAGHVFSVVLRKVIHSFADVVSTYDQWPTGVKGAAGVWDLKLWMRS